MRANGLPGLAGADHVGITVPDLDAAVTFMVDVIGCDYVFDGGASGRNPDLMRRNLGVHPDAEFKYCFLRCKSGSNFELFEYSAPDQVTSPPKNSDIGGHHVAFYVDDIDAAVTYLEARGVVVQGEVDRITAGPAAGSAWVYFLAPWGMQFELVSYPTGKAYESSSPIRLWHPSRPEQ